MDGIGHAVAAIPKDHAPLRYGLDFFACRPMGPACILSLCRKERSGAQRAFEFFLGPLDDVVELFFALAEL
jgi:hypothetical protein